MRRIFLPLVTVAATLGGCAMSPSAPERDAGDEWPAVVSFTNEKPVVSGQFSRADYISYLFKAKTEILRRYDEFPFVITLNDGAAYYDTSSVGTSCRNYLVTRPDVGKVGQVTFCGEGGSPPHKRHPKKTKQLQPRTNELNSRFDY